MGLEFPGPLLDTFLLGQLLFGEGPGLEALAHRFGVPVLGRHTALGDALMTAGVFARMIPLLKAQGLSTPLRALEARRKVALPRLKSYRPGPRARSTSEGLFCRCPSGKWRRENRSGG